MRSCREAKRFDSRASFTSADPIRKWFTAYLSSTLPGLLGIVLLCSGLGCSRHSSSEPVTITFLDVEWEASVPGGKEGRAGVLGGNGLAVSRFSAHPREAMELIRFLRRRDAEFLHTTEHSEQPKDFELYELPAVLQLYPQLTQLRKGGGGVVARPSITAGQKYEEVTRAYIGTLHSVLTGQTAAVAGAAALEKQLVEVTGFKTGPPSKLGSSSRESSP
jgi:hypothetical protein